MLTKNTIESDFKRDIVQLVLNKQTEQAIELLAEKYNVDIPKLKVGLPKGHTRNAFGTYDATKQTISVLNSDILGNPFVVLHEFYHHLRCRNVDKQHKGTEKNADKFAIDYLHAYEILAKSNLQSNKNSGDN